MGKIIEENHKIAYKKMQDKWKKRHKREKILTFFIAIFIIITTVLLLHSYNNCQNRAIDNCMHNGKSFDYCYRKLG